MTALIEGADALLILGGEDRIQWHRSRAAHGYYVACLAAGLAPPRLLVTGSALCNPAGIQDDTAPGREMTEAGSMAHFLRSQGVPPEHILQEAQALDTLGNVALGGALAASHGLTRLVLVSDDFHQWRTRRLFERVWGHPPAGWLGTGNAGTWRLRLREKLAYALQIAALRKAGVTPGQSSEHLDFLASRTVHTLRQRPK